MAVDALDTAYNNLMGVCDGRPLAGFTPTLSGVGDNLGEPERQFAGWLETLGEGAKRFTAETSSYLKQHGGGGYLGQFCADGQMVQFCDYAVKHWDNIEGASKVIRAREVQLASEGKFFPLDGSMGTIKQRAVNPYMAGGNLVRPGKFRMMLKDAKRARDRGLGSLYGEPDEDADAYVDKEISADMSMLASASFGIVENGAAEYMVDLGEFGVAGFERVMDVPYTEVQHLRGVDGTLGGAGAPFYLGTYGLDGRVGNWFKRLWNGVKAVFKKAFSWLGKVIKKVVTAVKKAVAWTIEKAKQVVSWTKEKLTDFKTYMQGTFDKIGAALGRAFTFVKNGVLYIWDKFKGFCKKVGDKIVQVAQKAWELVKAFAQKVAEVFKKFARYLNPKNIIGRTAIMNQVRKGKNGIATGVYYGMVGEAESKRLGVTGKQYQDSKEAYDKLRGKYVDEFAGSEESLKKYIRAGFGRWDGKVRTEAAIRQECDTDGKRMDEDQLMASAQEEVKRKEGLNGGGGGDLISLIVNAVVTLFQLIVELIKSIFAFITAKRAMKHESKMFDKQAAEVHREQDLQKEQQDKAYAEAQANRKAAAEEAAKNREEAAKEREKVVKQTASISRSAIIGLGIVAALAMFKSFQRNRTMQTIAQRKGGRKNGESRALTAGRMQPGLAM